MRGVLPVCQFPILYQLLIDLKFCNAFLEETSYLLGSSETGIGIGLCRLGAHLLGRCEVASFEFGSKVGICGGESGWQ